MLRTGSAREATPSLDAEEKRGVRLIAVIHGGLHSRLGRAQVVAQPARNGVVGFASGDDGDELAAAEQQPVEQTSPDREYIGPDDSDVTFDESENVAGV